MSIERIELRKKYYDGNMVREAVMSVTDDYNTIMKLLSAFSDQPPLTDVIEVVRCKDCRWWDKKDEDAKYGYCHAAKHGYWSANWEISIYRTYREDFFCADGKRREDDN